MEPVSLAVGVVPLALNIVQLTSTIRRQLESYKSASKEIAAVVDRTTKIHLICRSLETDLPGTDPGFITAPDSEPVPLRMILEDCYSRLTNIHDVVRKVLEKGARPIPLVDSKSVQYLLSKSKIEKSLEELDGSIHMLSLYMQFSTLKAAQQLVQTFPRHGSHLLSPCPQTTRQQPMQQSGTTLGRASRRKGKYAQRTTSWSKWFYFKQDSTSYESQHEGFGNDDESSYLIGSPVLGLYIRLSMQSGALSPLSVTLNVPQILHRDNFDEYTWDEMTIGMPDDAADVLRWMKQWQISPQAEFVYDAGQRRSYSLIGLAVAIKLPQVFSFLLQEGYASIGDQPHFINLERRSIRYEPFSTSDIAIQYIDARGPNLTIEEFRSILQFFFHPELFNMCFDRGRDVFYDEKADFDLICLFQLTDCVTRTPRMYVGTPFETMADNWVSSMSRILATGVDIHSTSSDFETMFVFLVKLDVADDSREKALYSKTVVSLWLRILEKCGLDLNMYLAEEIAIISKWEAKPVEADIPATGDPGEILDAIFDWARPLWRQPEAYSETSDLLLLLPNLRQNLMSHSLRSVKSANAATPRQNKKQWNDEVQVEWAMRLQWPFTFFFHHIEIDREANARKLLPEHQERYDAHMEAMNLLQERFERRQLKKWQRYQTKQARLSGLRNMPGAWEEEWWENTSVL